MNIGVDMDSVIAEIIRPIDIFHNRVYKTSLGYKSHSTYDLQSLWTCTQEEMYGRVFEFYHSPEFDDTKPIEGSQTAIKELSKTHTLHLITARPYDIEHKTRHWVDTFFPRQFASITHTNLVSKDGKGAGLKKSAIGKKLKIEIMIDDHIPYALDCADNGIFTLLFNAPWNEHVEVKHPYVKKVASWTEVCYTISHESQKPHHQDRARI